MRREFDIGQWLEHQKAPSARVTVLDAISSALGEARYLDIDVGGLGLPDSINNPLEVLRGKVVPPTVGGEEDRFVYYPDKEMLIGRVKDNPERPGSPVNYYCARVSKDAVPEGVPFILPQYISRADLHRRTAQFIVTTINREDTEAFTSTTLRDYLRLPDSDDGLRRAGQELDYFTRQMNPTNAPDGWRGWSFLSKGMRYRLQQTRKTEAARSAREEPRGVNKGRSVLSSWLIVNITGTEVQFDTRANTTV
jgi:hypothetical protein